MQRIARVLGTAGAVVGLALLNAVPVPAAVIDTGSEQRDETFPVGSCTAADGTVYDFIQRDVGTYSWRDKFRGPAFDFGYDQVWFASSQDDVVQTFTNVQTGLSWSGHAVSRGKDQRLLAVDGTRQTYLASRNGHFDVFAPDGGVAARQDVRIEYTFEVDTLGTPDPEDDIWAFLETTKFVGRDNVRDFCTDALEYTVPAS